jgi:NADH dehydrogenase
MKEDPQALDTLPRIVIVGGGFGGLEAARALRPAPARVTVIDRTNHHLFQPLLYQVATAGLSPADIAAPIRHILRNQRNTAVLMAEVVGVDTEHRRVLLQDGQRVEYDTLILATGSRHSYFGHDEWEPFAPGLKSLPDATTLRRNILEVFETAEKECDPDRQRELMTFVLVGAGPTGVEMAGAIAELAHTALQSDYRHINPKSARILLLEAGPRILASFPEDLATKAQRKLTQMGVEVRTNAKVEQVDADGVVAAGERIRSKTVIWTAGVAASPAGKWLNAPTDKAGRIQVEPDLSVPGHPEIFVIGDTATREQDGKPLPGVAPVAMQEGRYVGSVLRARLEGRPAPPPFRYFDKGNLATVGRSFAIVDAFHIRLAGFLAWVMWLVVHIFYLIGFRNRVMVVLQWAWAYFTFQRGARILSPNDQDQMPTPSRACLDVPEETEAVPETHRERSLV